MIVSVLLQTRTRQVYQLAQSFPVTHCTPDSLPSNLPVIKDNPVLQSFLTEPFLGEWRKHCSISYEEGSTGNRVDHIEEIAIPSNLEGKLAYVSCPPEYCS